MPAKARGRQGMGQPVRRSLDSSASQSRTQTSTQETPKRKLQEAPKKTPEYQTPSRQDTSSERSAVRASRLFSVPRKTPGRLRGATPYRTPRLTTLPRQQETRSHSVKKLEAKLWQKHLRGFLNRSLKICSLSSVANFKYSDKQLRVKYEKTLRNKIMEVYPSPQIEVNIVVTSCLSWDSSVVDAVWFEVKSLVPGDTPEDDKMVVVYNSWLIRTVRVQSSNIQNVDWLPVMLYLGREFVHQVVVNWLQGSFGCYVTRSGMQQSDFLWLAGVWSSNKCFDASHNDENAKVEFTYMIIPPRGMSSYSYPNDRGKPRIAVKLLMKDIQEVWKRIVGNSKKKVSIEKLQGYLSAITSMTSCISGLPVSLLRLYQLKTPCVTLNSNGKVRLVCQRSIRAVIQSFLDVFLQRTTSYHLEQDFEDSDETDSIAELNNNYV